MRATLTVASSRMPTVPWWRNVSVDSERVPGVLRLALYRLFDGRSLLASSGMAVTIRVPGNAAPDCRHLASSRQAEVVKFARNSEGNSSDNGAKIEA